MKNKKFKIFVTLACFATSAVCIVKDYQTIGGIVIAGTIACCIVMFLDKIDYDLYRNITSKMAVKHSIEDKLSLLDGLEDIWLSHATPEEVSELRRIIAQIPADHPLRDYADYLLKRAERYGK